MTAMAALDGREVVEAFQQGDREAAMAELYRRYGGFVYGFVAKRTNPALAEDLTQDVFLNALGGLDRWQWQGTDPRAWLVSIARNLIAGHHRTAARRPVIADADIEDLGLAARGADVELTVIHRRDLLAAFEVLTDDQRDVIRRRYLDDMSVTDAAKAMGRTGLAIRQLTFRATRNLAAQLGSYAEAVS